MTIRPALRPGATLLRRDGDHLQIGTSPGYVVHDQPGLFRVIKMMDGVRSLHQISRLARANIPEFRGDVAQIVHELRAAGLVFDARSWDIPVGSHLRDEARAASLSGADASQLVHRDRFLVTFDLDARCTPLSDATTGILDQAGIGLTAIDPPDLRVMMSNAEPSRHRFEAAMDSRQDHLRVVIDEDRVRIGPLVRPGLTPCISCHDLHRADWDRAWPALMTQFGTPATTAPALRATTLHAAATFLAATVIAYCDEDPADTTGQCVVIGPHFLDRKIWPISFHPACSCAVLTAA